jgi:hypothetical protein
MVNELLEHPWVTGLAFLAALPFGWPLVRAFSRSTAEDVVESVRSPSGAYFGYFMLPEWTLLKLVYLCVAVVALTVTFFKCFMFVGGQLGLLA